MEGKHSFPQNCRVGILQRRREFSDSSAEQMREKGKKGKRVRERERKGRREGRNEGRREEGGRKERK